jgi:hypothetical protein
MPYSVIYGRTRSNIGIQGRARSPLASISRNPKETRASENPSAGPARWSRCKVPLVRHPSCRRRVDGRIDGTNGMRISKDLKRHLIHRDRWRVEHMLLAQPDLREINPERDMGLWRHLYAPDDGIQTGEIVSSAAIAKTAEFCSGNTWCVDGILSTVAICWSALVLLRGATYKEAMSRRQACEAVIGRLRFVGIEIVMVVDDGDGGLECWIDPPPGSYPVYSRGRCPGGTNSKTGQTQRVVWAHPATRIDWIGDNNSDIRAA